MTDDEQIERNKPAAARGWLADRHSEVLPNLGEHGGRIRRHLGHFLQDALRSICQEEVDDAAVVVVPDAHGERRMPDEDRVTAAEQRVGDLPGTAEHEDVHRLGQQALPEVEK